MDDGVEPTGPAGPRRDCDGVKPLGEDAPHTARAPYTGGGGP
jgi:hypothetical protein